MKATPEIVPVSELRNDYNAILALADKAPVFLTKNGHAAGVLISTTAWDRLFEKLEELQDVIDVLEAELALARGEDEYGEMTAKDLAAMYAMAVGNAVPA